MHILDKILRYPIDWMTFFTSVGKLYRSLRNYSVKVATPPAWDL
jgi:hypothetical protein